MKSQWTEFKGRAIQLRKRGMSIRTIEQKLAIPRSTLSGWLRGISLTPSQKKKLDKRWEDALVSARKKAVVWHNNDKLKRLEEARQQANATLLSLPVNNRSILELTLAILYAGEGSKKNLETALGSSNPLILRFFVQVLRTVYKVDIQKMRCELYLRADQNPSQLKKYWSKELALPLSCFRQVNIDRRTLGSKTYDSYKGVCHVRCGNVAIQRKLVLLANSYMQSVVEKA
ncbi:MAG: hypothetical protein WC817_00430 [Patescibacteria group bacterium]|jgi:hypothetical protein